MRFVVWCELGFSHADNLYVKKVSKWVYNNVKYKNSPYYKGSQLWDALPLTTINCDTLYEFKKHLKKRYVIYLDV